MERLERRPSFRSPHCKCSVGASRITSISPHKELLTTYLQEDDVSSQQDLVEKEISGDNDALRRNKMSRAQQQMCRLHFPFEEQQANANVLKTLKDVQI